MSNQERLARVSDDTFRVTIPPEKPISYDIIIGENLFSRIALDLAGEKPASKYAVITDSRVRSLPWFSLLEESLYLEGLSFKTFDFEHGEQNKKMQQATTLLEKLGQEGYNRDSMILSVGGGVVGDLAGYVAASYCRGIPFIDIPTTTLSQADSAIGGKKGVDLSAGKNLAGAFAQAWRVYMDLATLKTLDESNYRAGLVEGIKHGVIADRAHFEFFENNRDFILARSIQALKEITERNCHIKGTVVQKDPKEKGLRRILNYGHTLGHAIEKLSNYQLSHGHCVAIGMNFAGYLAHEIGAFPLDEVIRQRRLLESLGFNLRIPHEMTPEQIVKTMGVDKKAEAGKIRFCLPREIGTMEDFEGKYATPVDSSIVTDIIFGCR